MRCKALIKYMKTREVVVYNYIFPYIIYTQSTNIKLSILQFLERIKYIDVSWVGWGATMRNGIFVAIRCDVK